MDLQLFRSVIRMFKYRSFWNNYAYRNFGFEEAYVLGNGPSLNESLKKLDLRGKELYVLNNFAMSEEYAKLKPRHYVIADSFYWRLRPEETALKTILESTDWKMYFYMPMFAYRNKKVQEYLSDNKNVTVVPYHANYIEGYGKWQKKAYENNYGMPILANVLVATLYLAINNGVKHIHLLGADHSWTESIRVNDKNEVCIADTHFNSETTYTPWKNLDGSNITMAEILESFARFFRGYEKIRSYSEDMNVKIINETPGSFIDVFERK